MVSIQQVAERAKVSVSTVSRALNDPDLVKGETRQQVYSAISELGYNPAQRKSKKSYNIGLSVPDMTIPLVNEIIVSLEEELFNSPYDLIILHTKMKRRISRFFRENTVYKRKIDALIIFSAELDEESVDFFRSMAIPVVLLHTRCSREKTILTNNYWGAFDAVQFLIGRGYREIGFIGWEPKDDHLTDRFYGYKNAIEKAGLVHQAEMDACGALNPEGGYRATVKLFRAYRPEAVFYACDGLAFGGYRYFREKGLRVPQDIGIVGFDDLAISSAFGLTTMKQFIQVKIRMAVSYLLDRLNGKIASPQEEEVSITPKLVVRDSTK